MSARKTVLLICVMLASFSGSVFAAGVTIPVGAAFVSGQWDQRQGFDPAGRRSIKLESDFYPAANFIEYSLGEAANG